MVLDTRCSPMNPHEITTLGEKIITVIALLLVTALGGIDLRRR
jgi:hypothetical protein